MKLFISFKKSITIKKYEAMLQGETNFFETKSLCTCIKAVKCQKTFYPFLWAIFLMSAKNKHNS